MPLTEAQLERRQQRGLAMVQWITALNDLPDETKLTITLGQLKAISIGGHAICGYPTTNFCGEVIKQLCGDQQSDRSRDAARCLDGIK